MNPDTLKALKQSIEHWKRLATGNEKPKEEPYTENCALCGRFFGVLRCRGCPVMERTGHDQCGTTPYMDAWLAWSRWKLFNDKETEAVFRAAAKKELAFLKTLLPKKPRKKATK